MIIQVVNNVVNATIKFSMTKCNSWGPRRRAPNVGGEVKTNVQEGEIS